MLIILLDKPYTESEILKGYKTMAAALGSKFTDVPSENNEDSDPVQDDENKILEDPTDGFDVGGSNNSGLDKLLSCHRSERGIKR